MSVDQIPHLGVVNFELGWAKLIQHFFHKIGLAEAHEFVHNKLHHLHLWLKLCPPLDNKYHDETNVHL